jgi:hypothetical protein
LAATVEPAVPAMPHSSVAGVVSTTLALRRMRAAHSVARVSPKACSRLLKEAMRSSSASVKIWKGHTETLYSAPKTRGSASGAATIRAPAEGTTMSDTRRTVRYHSDSSSSRRPSRTSCV